MRPERIPSLKSVAALRKWTERRVPRMTGDLAGRRVLVTGGAGFIGGRLVEKLILELGANVRVLTSNFANAARVSRFDLQVVKGDITEGCT